MEPALIAAKFLGFCEDSELRLKALKLGLELSGRTSLIENALELASEFILFATWKPVVKTQRGSKKRGRR